MIDRLLDPLLYRWHRIAWRWRTLNRRYKERTRPQEPAPGPSLYLLRLPTPGRSARLVLERPGHIEDELVQRGGYEAYITSLLLFLMKEDGVFIDVGANFGLHALQIAGALPNARCLCFEPHPEVHDALKRNIRASGFGNVSAYPVALGDVPGDVDFYMHDAGTYNRGLSSMVPTSDTTGFRRARVEMTTLDAFLPESERERLSVVKIDVQGAERRVLLGMREILASVQPAVVFEFEADYARDPEAEIRGILDALPQHRVFQIRPGHPELQSFDPSAARGKGYWVNLVALPKSAWSDVLRKS